MIAITAKLEHRKQIEKIQKKFKDQLSPNVILTSTVQAINGTMSRAIPKIKKAVKEEYNITPKYLKRIAKVSPKAKAPNKLYAGISLQYTPIPIIAFKPKQTTTGIELSIRKGNRQKLPHSFIQTMHSGHEGVFFRGGYVKRKAKRGKDRLPITQAMTASPFTMGTNKGVSQQVVSFMGKEVLRAMEGILTQKVSILGK